MIDECFMNNHDQTQQIRSKFYKFLACDSVSLQNVLQSSYRYYPPPLNACRDHFASPYICVLFVTFERNT